MDQTLDDIARHALATVEMLAGSNNTVEARLNMINKASGIFVTLQRAIYRAHDQLYKLEGAARPE
jgi:hypothetical protein